MYIYIFVSQHCIQDLKYIRNTRDTSTCLKGHKHKTIDPVELIKRNARSGDN